MNSNEKIFEETLNRAISEKPKTRLRRSDLREVMEAKKGLIQKALSQGHSRTGLAKMLKESGVNASVETIRAYLGDVMGAKNKTTSSKAKVFSEEGRVKVVPVAKTGTKVETKPGSSSGNFKTIDAEKL